MENESFRFEEVYSKNQKSSQQLDWEENNLKFDDLFSPDDFNEKDKINYSSQTIQLLEQLRKSLKQWEQAYLLISSTDGVVSYQQFWGENQFIKAGDATVSIIPKDKMAVVGRMQVPSTNSGKIAQGQKVLIKLDNFRYQEYGIVEGKVQNISLTPDEKGNYYVDIILPNGLKTSYNLEHFGAIAQYAKSSLTNEYKTNNSLENGYVAHFELNGNFEDLTSAVGLIKTSKKGGADIITSYGDSISPFEDGNQVYTLDARTIYGSLGYSIYDFEFGALYGITRYDDSSSGLKEKELNLSAGYNFTKNLNTNIMYVNVDADQANGDTDYNKYLASVEYKF